jgi:dTDP-4-dehydrorhamnose reductase
MRILLFGANGQLGTALRQSLQPLGEVVATTRDGILLDGSRCLAADFATPEVLPGLVRQAAPDIVVNAAAYTAVDHAEDDTEAAFRVNAEAPARIAEACAACNATLVHYSTDYVFDGRSTRPYREDDAVDPLGVYGESKRAGELAVLAAGTRHIVLRTAWVYSTSCSGRRGCTPGTAEISCGRCSAWLPRATNCAWWPISSDRRHLPR